MPTLTAPEPTWLQRLRASQPDVRPRCTVCGKRPAAPERRLCYFCADQRNATKHRQRGREAPA